MSSNSCSIIGSLTDGHMVSAHAEALALVEQNPSPKPEELFAITATISAVGKLLQLQIAQYVTQNKGKDDYIHEFLLGVYDIYTKYDTMSGLQHLDLAINKALDPRNKLAIATVKGCAGFYRGLPNVMQNALMIGVPLAKAIGTDSLRLFLIEVCIHAKKYGAAAGLELIGRSGQQFHKDLLGHSKILRCEGNLHIEEYLKSHSRKELQTAMDCFTRAYELHLQTKLGPDSDFRWADAQAITTWANIALKGHEQPVDWDIDTTRPMNDPARAARYYAGGLIESIEEMVLPAPEEGERIPYVPVSVISSLNEGALPFLLLKHVIDTAADPGVTSLLKHRHFDDIIEGLAGLIDQPDGYATIRPVQALFTDMKALLLSNQDESDVVSFKKAFHEATGSPNMQVRSLKLLQDHIARAGPVLCAARDGLTPLINILSKGIQTPMPVIDSDIMWLPFRTASTSTIAMSSEADTVTVTDAVVFQMRQIISRMLGVVAKQADRAHGGCKTSAARAIHCDKADFCKYLESSSSAGLSGPVLWRFDGQKSVKQVTQEIQESLVKACVKVNSTALWPNQRIAEFYGVDDKTVAAIRQRLGRNY